jgi:hypothetical protein
VTAVEPFAAIAAIVSRLELRAWQLLLTSKGAICVLPDHSWVEKSRRTNSYCSYVCWLVRRVVDVQSRSMLPLMVASRVEVEDDTNVLNLEGAWSRFLGEKFSLADHLFLRTPKLFPRFNLFGECPGSQAGFVSRCGEDCWDSSHLTIDKLLSCSEIGALTY